jgi:hypothetical protein
MGGTAHAQLYKEESKVKKLSRQAIKLIEENEPERFQRPSKDKALKLKYSYEEASNPKRKFSTSKDVIEAYYTILKHAANMDGFYGGCGTVNGAKGPYSDAYRLLSKSTKEKMTQEEYIDSFKGIGYMTLLKLEPAYRPAGTPKNIDYYMVEVEVITGPPMKEDKDVDLKQGSYFEYYYGVVTAENGTDGWKIKAVDYIGEDFLCAPWHLWDWDAELLTNVVYENWYKIINKIDKVNKVNSNISIYASRSKNKYKFDFVRLTNGTDIMLHEYIWQNGAWKETNILKPEHQSYKFSILNFK